MDDSEGINSTVASRISEAEGSLLVSKQCQQNGLLSEAVMSTVEALEHIEKGLLVCPKNASMDHLKNLQFKADCLLDCLTRMSKSKETNDELAALTDLMALEDSGLMELNTMRAVNYSQCDSSRSIIYSLDEDGMVVSISKVIRPRLIYFLQVRMRNGDKIYTIPLREETHICLDKSRTEIILPDHSIDGFAVIRLESPTHIAALIALLEEYMIPYDSVEEDDGPSSNGAYPHRLVRGASLVSMGLKRGAEKTGEFLTWGTPYVISKLAKSETNVPINENWRTTANVAKSVTTTAASVSSRFADKLGTATMAIGKFLAPHAQVAGSRLLVHATGTSEENASETMNNMLNFTAGAVTAVATVFEGIEESVKTIGTSVGENSGKIIEHKYGAEAAAVATDTFDTIGNVYTISKHTKILQPKGILKSAVKNTGRGILHEISTNPGPDDGGIEGSSQLASTAVEEPSPPPPEDPTGDSRATRPTSH